MKLLKVNVVAVMLAALVTTGFAASRPNIVVILADDQGWNATSMQVDPNEPGSGSKYFRTPNLDKLMTQGMRFSQAYSPAPTCSPTRHAIQFGRSPSSLQIWGADGIKSWDADNSESLANVLKKAQPDYVCAHFGKWHIGTTLENMGFEVNDGPNGNGTGNSKDSKDPKLIFSLSRKSNEFMEKQVKAGKPFFVQISHYANHLKYQGLEETIKKYETKYAGDATEYQNEPLWAAMNENLDTGVGMVLDKIKELGIEDNTYVIYTADNGYENKRDGTKPAHERAFYEAYPQRSHKYTVSEGGIRVPFIVRGPGIPANVHSYTAVAGIDIYPTVMDIAGGVDLPERVEGGSLLAHLKSGGKDPVTRKDPFLVFKYSKPRPAHDLTIVKDNYKLIKDVDTGMIYLFDLKKDISESKNLADEKPDLAKSMYADLTAYFKRLNWDESKIETQVKKPAKKKKK